MSQYDPQQCRNLIASIFVIAIRDFQHGGPRVRQGIKDFIYSEYAEKLASYLEQVDIQDIREKINELDN